MSGRSAWKTRAASTSSPRPLHPDAPSAAEPQQPSNRQQPGTEVHAAASRPARAN